ncbi:hypothetical protein DL767_010881 [Monosporascus sp. MG133]|nr:hypothetical protein DL767_010881 [Monosporascus sp. MG133]
MNGAPVDINTTPAAQSPTGVYDFDSPVNSAMIFYVVSSVFMVLAAIVVLLKLYIRLFVHKKPGLDDVCTVGAFILQTTYVALLDHLFANGGARHQWDMSIAKLQSVLSQQSRAAIIQMPTYLLAKLALLFLFHRIFGPKKAFKWAIIVGCIVVTCVYLTVMFIYVFADAQGVLVPTSYGVACINLITDIYLLVLPMAAINSLHLPLARKIGIAAVFAAGLLACAMSALALYYRFNTIAGHGAVDMTYTVAPRAIVLVVEIYVGIMIGCFPVLPSLSRKTHLTKFFSNTFGSLRSWLVSVGASSTSKSGQSRNDDDYPLSSRDKPVSLHSGSNAV